MRDLLFSSWLRRSLKYDGSIEAKVVVLELDLVDAVLVRDHFARYRTAPACGSGLSSTSGHFQDALKVERHDRDAIERRLAFQSPFPACAQTDRLVAAAATDAALIRNSRRFICAPVYCGSRIPDPLALDSFLLRASANAIAPIGVFGSAGSSAAAPRPRPPRPPPPPSFDMITKYCRPLDS